MSVATVGAVVVGPADYGRPPVQALLRELSAHYVDTYGASDVLDDDPGWYASPTGGCLVAGNPAPVGVVLFRRFDAATAEMVRFYVSPAGRGSGAAPALFTAALRQAGEAGYERVVGCTASTAVASLVASAGGRQVPAGGAFADLPGVRCYEVATAAIPSLA